jgi:pimeloyl-ACP methyl ester carboxylesterase
MTRTVQVDVGTYEGLGGPMQVAMDVHVPERLAEGAALFFCLPGGGVTRRYFDLDGGPGTAFSFAKAMTAQGHVVVAVDPIGVGDSSRPEDGFALTAEVEAELIHRAFLAMRQMEVGGVALGALRVIGGGHSAGALVSVVQQARWRDFDAMILFCFGSGGLPAQLAPEQKAALADPDGGRSRVVEFARKKFAGHPYVEPPVRYDDSPASKALRAAHSLVVTVVGILAMTPGNVRPELATIDVPVFLSVGDRDMTGPPHLLAGDYVACPDFTFYVVATSGHHVFVAPTAPALYARVLNWTAGLAVGGG